MLPQSAQPSVKSVTRVILNLLFFEEFPDLGRYADIKKDPTETMEGEVSSGAQAKVQGVTAEKPWWKGLQAVCRVATALVKSEIKVGTQLAFCVLLRPGPQSME